MGFNSGFKGLIYILDDGITSLKVKHDSYYGTGTQTTLSVIYRKYGDVRN